MANRNKKRPIPVTRKSRSSILISPSPSPKSMPHVFKDVDAAELQLKDRSPVQTFRHTHSTPARIFRHNRIYIERWELDAIKDLRKRNPRSENTTKKQDVDQSKQSDGTHHQKLVVTISTGKATEMRAQRRKARRSSTNVKGSQRVHKSKAKHAGGKAQQQAEQKPLRTDKQRERNRLQIQENCSKKKALSDLRSQGTASQTAEEYVAPSVPSRQHRCRSPDPRKKQRP